MANEKAQVAAVATDSPPPEFAPFQSDTRFFGHPRGLATLFFTEMWERFSFYGIRPLLVLFMTAAILDNGFGFERSQATAIVGIYTGSVYLASLPGGWIADRWLGLQRSIWWGGVFIMLGHFSIALSAVFAKSSFFLGLIFIVMGPSVGVTRIRYVIRPMSMPTPAAPKPKCHPTRSPRNPVTTGAMSAPVLMPM